MYSSKAIEDSLDKFSAREGWMPIRHTINEVDEFKERVNSAVSIEHNSRNSYVGLSRKITEAEASDMRRFVENEQVMCSIDYSYWESRYAYVRNEMGEIVRFANRKSQSILDYIIADLGEKEIPIELLVLGSRQTGISQKIIQRIFHKSVFHPYTNSIIATAVNGKEECLVSSYSVLYENCPWWLVPSRTKKNTFVNGSSISFYSGLSMYNMARGYTPSSVYIDGVGDILRSDRVIEEGVLRAIQSSKNTLLVLHGTIGDKSDWMKHTWEYAAKYWSKGLSRFMPVFIPWFVCSDIYPTKSWIERFPVPENWKPSKKTRDHVAQCEAYLKTQPHLLKIMGSKWKMPIEQKWYWEYCYNYAKATHMLPRFLASMAASDQQNIELNESINKDVDIEDVFPSAADTQSKINRK